MSSECPPQLHLSLTSTTTSFKRSFEEFGFDLDSPVGSGSEASSSGSHGALGSHDGNDRNKRPRSESNLSDSGDSAQSSPTASTSSGRSFSSASDGPISGLTATRPAASHSAVHVPLTSHRSSAEPPRLPTPEIQDIEMPDYSLAPSPVLSSTSNSQHDEQYRLSLERFNAFDSQISALRRSHPLSSPSPPIRPRTQTPPPTLPPLVLPSADEDAPLDAPFPSAVGTQHYSPLSPGGSYSSASPSAPRMSQPHAIPYSSSSSHDNTQIIDIRADSSPLFIGFPTSSISHPRPASPETRTLESQYSMFRDHLNSALEQIQPPSPFISFFPDAFPSSTSDPARESHRRRTSEGASSSNSGLFNARSRRFSAPVDSRDEGISPARDSLTENEFLPRAPLNRNTPRSSSDHARTSRLADWASRVIDEDNESIVESSHSADAENDTRQPIVRSRSLLHYHDSTESLPRFLSAQDPGSTGSRASQPSSTSDTGRNQRDNVFNRARGEDRESPPRLHTDLDRLSPFRLTFEDHENRPGWVEMESTANQHLSSETRPERHAFRPSQWTSTIPDLSEGLSTGSQPPRLQSFNPYISMFARQQIPSISPNPATHRLRYRPGRPGASNSLVSESAAEIRRSTARAEMLNSLPSSILPLDRQDAERAPGPSFSSRRVTRPDPLNLNSSRSSYVPLGTSSSLFVPRSGQDSVGLPFLGFLSSPNSPQSPISPNAPPDAYSSMLPNFREERDASLRALRRERLRETLYSDSRVQQTSESSIPETSFQRNHWDDVSAPSQPAEPVANDNLTDRTYSLLRRIRSREAGPNTVGSSDMERLHTNPEYDTMHSRGPSPPPPVLPRRFPPRSSGLERPALFTSSQTTAAHQGDPRFRYGAPSLPAPEFVSRSLFHDTLRDFFDLMNEYDNGPTLPALEQRPSPAEETGSNRRGHSFVHSASSREFEMLDPNDFHEGPFRDTIQSFVEANRQGSPPWIPPLSFETYTSPSRNPFLQGRNTAPSHGQTRNSHSPQRGSINETFPPRQSTAVTGREMHPWHFSSTTRATTQRNTTQRAQPPRHYPYQETEAPSQASDVHSFLSLRPRIEAARLATLLDSGPDRHGPPQQNGRHTASRGEEEGLHHAIEVMRHDGLSNDRSYQLIRRFRQERGEPERRSSRNSSYWGNIEGDTEQAPPPPPTRRRHQLFNPNPEPEPRSSIDSSDSDSPRSSLPRRPYRLQEHSSARARNLHRGTFGSGDTRAHNFLGLGSRVGFARRLRNMGDYVRDEDFDTSYEGLLNLAATLGDVIPKHTPDDVIASLPTGSYQDWVTTDSDRRCPICLDDYKPLDPVLKLPECLHWLHKECLEQWLRGANTCPVCRQVVRSQRSPEHREQNRADRSLAASNGPASNRRPEHEAAHRSPVPSSSRRPGAWPAVVTSSSQWGSSTEHSSSFRPVPSRVIRTGARPSSHFRAAWMVSPMFEDPEVGGNDGNGFTGPSRNSNEDPFNNFNSRRLG